MSTLSKCAAAVSRHKLRGELRQTDSLNATEIDAVSSTLAATSRLFDRCSLAELQKGFVGCRFHMRTG